MFSIENLTLYPKSSFILTSLSNTAQTTYSYIVRAVLSQIHPLFLPYLIGTVSVLESTYKKCLREE